MKRLLIISLVVIQVLKLSAQETYKAEWESLKNYNAPEWYEDAKLGFWPIWGIYSIPAFKGTHAAEWYGRWMYCKEGQEREHLHPELFFEHHKKTYGDQSEFGYKDFIPMFTADKFDPNEWAALCEEMGAKYFCTLGIFHDGFNMGKSKLTKWNAIEMGPKRDIVGELAVAARKRGLKYGVSNHFAFNSRFFGFNHINGFDAKDPANAGLYGRPIVAKWADTLRYMPGESRESWLRRAGGAVQASEFDMDHWLARTKEMADLYQPDLYYFDWGMNGAEFESRRKAFGAHYYNQAIEWGKGTYGSPGVVLNYKNAAFEEGSAVRDYERGGAHKTEVMVWQTDDSVYNGHNWGYAEGTPIKNINNVIDNFVRIVSRRGNLMLAFAPKADGSFPEDQKAFIRKMGGWMNVCGEAIYATRPWIKDQENSALEHSDKTVRVHFTRSKDEKHIYAILLNWHATKVTIKTINTSNIEKKHIKRVSLIGSNKKFDWSINEKGLTIDFTGYTPDYDYAFPIKIALKNRKK